MRGFCGAHNYSWALFAYGEKYAEPAQWRYNEHPEESFWVFEKYDGGDDNGCYALRQMKVDGGVHHLVTNAEGKYAVMSTLNWDYDYTKVKLQLLPGFLGEAQEEIFTWSWTLLTLIDITFGQNKIFSNFTGADDKGCYAAVDIDYETFNNN